MRNSKGQFIKGEGFWTGKKRPGFKNNSTFSKGLIPWNKGLKGWRAGESHPWKKGKVPKSAFQIGHIPVVIIHPKGEDHWNWKGGITPQNHKIRNSIQYKEWRDFCLKRDSYTCVLCGNKGRDVDHIKPFYLYPNLRLDTTNGRTLCGFCHQKTPSYTGKRIYVSS